MIQSVGETETEVRKQVCMPVLWEHRGAAIYSWLTGGCAPCGRGTRGHLAFLFYLSSIQVSFLPPCLWICARWWDYEITWWFFFYVFGELSNVSHKGGTYLCSHLQCNQPFFFLTLSRLVMLSLLFYLFYFMSCSTCMYVCASCTVLMGTALILSRNFIGMDMLEIVSVLIHEFKAPLHLFVCFDICSYSVSNQCLSFFLDEVKM